MNNHRFRFAPALCSLALTLIVITGCQGDKHSADSSASSESNFFISTFLSLIGQKPKAQFPPAPGQNQNASTKGESSFLGLSLRSWLDCGLLGIGLAGTSLAVVARKSGHRHRQLLERNQKETTQLKKQLSSLEFAKCETSDQLSRLSQKISAAEGKIDNLTKRVNNPPPSTILSNQASSQSYDVSSLATNDPTSQRSTFGLSNLDQAVVPAYHPHSSPSVPFSSVSASNQPLQIQTSADRQAEITTAFNNGDRQVIRTVSSAQLNITAASDNAIAIGHLLQTELEEVDAGGSYYLVCVGSESLLYPSEQTLRGFAEIRPSKGVFEYIKQAINAPQILSPARMDRSGENWCIQQTGRIAVPG